MPFVRRFTVTQNGAVTFTGNTLGLSKKAGENKQGILHSIGAFISVDSSLQAGDYPAGTTLDYRLNSSAAILRLPAYSEVLYAELVWGGSYKGPGTDYSSVLGEPVQFTTPAGSVPVAPDPATASRLPADRPYYVRTADVTALVREGGAGTYVCGRVVGTVDPAQDNLNHAGWTLAVVYGSPLLPSRQMTLWVGDVLVENTGGSPAIEITGFVTPPSGPQSGRVLVSAQEGDPGITGDQLRFGPAANQLKPLIGPNNPQYNFMGSQINDDAGRLDTSGTFGELNHPLGASGTGKRQGWDITSIGVNPYLSASQSAAVIQGLTSGDSYLLHAAAFQVDVNAPKLRFTLTPDEASAWIGQGITYRAVLANQGAVPAVQAVLTAEIPAHAQFIPGSVTVNGIPRPDLSPVSGLLLGSLAPGQPVSVSYVLKAASRPAGGGSGLSSAALLSYTFQSLPTGPPYSGKARTPQAEVVLGNRPPVTQDISREVSQGVPVSGFITASDPDGDALTYVLAAPPGHGSAEVQADGSYRYTSSPGFLGSESFTVRVEDGQGGAAEARVNVQINNRPPVTDHLQLTTPANRPVTGKVTASDPDGDPLTFSLASPPGSGEVILNGDGSFLYTPSPAFVGTDSFVVSVSDGHGGTALSAVAVAVTNEPPTAQDLSLRTRAGAAVTGTVSAQDGNGDPLTFSLLTLPGHGTAAVEASGAFTYTPAPRYVGADAFTVKVSDGQGGETAAAVSITVYNEPPAAQKASYATQENTPVFGAITASDGNGDPLTYSLRTAPFRGTVGLNADGMFVYSPKPGWSGIDVFTVTVDDGLGGTDTAVVSIAVKNPPPSVQGAQLTTRQGTAVNGAVIAVQPGGAPEPLGFTLLTPPGSGTVSLKADGTFTYMPEAGFAGWDAFTVMAENNRSGRSLGFVRIQVASDPPVSRVMAVRTAENTAVSGAVAAPDPGGTPLTFRTVAAPASGTVDLKKDGTFTYVPNAGHVGSDAFTVLLEDGNGGTAVAAVKVNVTNVPPVAQSQILPVPLDTAVNGRMTATDRNGDPLSFSLSAGPAHGSAQVEEDGAFTYTPAAGYAGPDAFTILVADGRGGTDVGTVAVMVTNRPPVVQPASVLTLPGSQVKGRVSGVDPEGGPLAYRIAVPPGAGEAAVEPDGGFVYKPREGVQGLDAFTVSVSDGSGGTAMAAVYAEVKGSPPVLEDVHLSTPRRTAASGRVQGSAGPGGGELSFALSAAPVRGTAQVNGDGTFTYTPDPEYPGLAVFGVRAEDRTGAVSTAAVTVNVYNQPPLAEDVPLVTGVDAPVTGKISAADADGDSLAFAVSFPPERGSVDLNAGGTFTYTPGAGFRGQDRFEVTVSDAHGGTARPVVTVSVPAPPPAAGPLTLNTRTGVPVSGLIPAAAAAGETLAYAIVEPPAKGAAALDSAGLVTYTPPAGFTGTESFGVKVSGSLGGSALLAVTVHVGHEPPVTGPASLSTPQNTPASGRIPAMDPQGNLLLFKLAAAPVSGSAAVDSGSGAFTYTPKPGFTGEDAFAVEVSDGLGTVARAPVTVTVYNRPPELHSLAVRTKRDLPIRARLAAVDPDGDALSFALGASPESGTVTVDPDGSFTYTPDLRYTGPDAFAVIARDGKGGEAAALVLVSVTNEPPAAADTALRTEINRSAGGRVLAVDPEGDPLTFRLLAPPAQGTAVLDPGGAFTYTPSTDYTGPDLFLVAVSDGHSEAAAAVKITVYSPLPAAQDLVLRVPENTTVSGVVTAVSPGGSPLTFSLLTAPGNGTARVGEDGSFTYTPNLHFTGTDSFTVRVEDAQGGRTAASVSVNVSVLLPLASDAFLKTPARTPLTGRITAVDPDGDPLSYHLLAAAGNGNAVVQEDGAFTYSPHPERSGADAFMVLVRDAQDGADVAAVHVNVTNEPPAAADLSISTPQNTAAGGAVTAADPNGGPLTFSLLTAASRGSVTVNPDGTFSYRPAQGYVGPDGFTVLVRDDQGASAAAAVSVEVTNDAPVAPDLTLRTPVGVPAAGRVNAVDPNGDAMTFKLAVQGLGGSAEVQGDGAFVYTPAPGFAGEDLFVLLVGDGKCSTAVVTVKVTVSGAAAE